MFFYPCIRPSSWPWEGNNVIDIALRKITSGGLNAAEETRLMVSENVKRHH
jgi:hypothetical protein